MMRDTHWTCHGGHLPVGGGRRHDCGCTQISRGRGGVLESGGPGGGERVSPGKVGGEMESGERADATKEIARGEVDWREESMRLLLAGRMSACMR